MEDTRQGICSEVETLRDVLFGTSDWLMEHPETAFKEFEACEYLGRVLEEQGFTVERGVGGIQTSFLAAPRDCRSRRPRVGFLAEYDALPGIGHGCGHNLIAAASIGAGISLRRVLGDQAGSVAIVGTPAEEGGGGKAILADAGVFDDTDIAMMVHPSNANLPAKDSLGRIKFSIEFFGRSAHASGSADQGLNALDALVMTYVGINSLRQHLRPDGRVHGIITHGGDAPNIIPEYTSGLFYVREGSIAYRDELLDRVRAIAQGAAMATGTETKITIDPPSLEPMKRNPALEAVVESNMTELGIPIDNDDGRKGSSDAGNLSHRLPTIHPLLRIFDPGSYIPGHSKAFCDATASPLGREALLNGAKILALTAFDYINSPELQDRVSQDFRREN